MNKFTRKLLKLVFSVLGIKSKNFNVMIILVKSTIKITLELQVVEPYFRMYWTVLPCDMRENMDNIKMLYIVTLWLYEQDYPKNKHNVKKVHPSPNKHFMTIIGLKKCLKWQPF